MTLSDIFAMEAIPAPVAYEEEYDRWYAYLKDSIVEAVIGKDILPEPEGRQSGPVPPGIRNPLPLSGAGDKLHKTAGTIAGPGKHRPGQVLHRVVCRGFSDASAGKIFRQGMVVAFIQPKDPLILSRVVHHDRGAGWA